MMKRPRPGFRQPIELLESRVFLSAADVIRNGGFEGTVLTGDWAPTGHFQADSRFTNFRTGAGYAYLANTDGSAGNNLSGTLYQQLTIPSTATSLTFSFWTRITTSETTTTAQNDVMTIRILDSAGASVLQTVGTLSNLNASGSYVQRTFSLARSLIGQTVQIGFEATTNASLATTFRIDDVALNAVSPATNNRIVGYLPSYRQSSFSKIDLSALTHLNYFSVTSSNAGVLSTGSITATNLNTVVTAAHAAGVTVSITVGPQSFSTLAASATARATFAANIVNYALTYNLDGIDIDWEPPAGNSVANYALLINDLYTAANPHRLLITAAVNPWTNEIPAATVNSKMDWLNVMCYDFSYANHSTYDQAVSGMVDWTNYGVTKNKIVMGVPFYGRSGTSWSNNVSRTYSAFVADYYNIHGQYPGPDVDSYTDASGATFYFNGVTTIERKAAYVRDNGYGGMMIWELGQDYWDASGNYNQYSLLPVIKTMMNPPAWLSPASGSRFNLVAGTFYLHAGTVTVASDAADTHPSLNVSVSGGATLLVSATQRLGGLTIANLGAVTINAGGDKTILVTSLSIGSLGKLDLKDNRLIVNYTGTSPASSTIVPRLLTARNSGAWTGSGITSSTAAADPARRTAIGYAEASDLGVTTFGGLPVDSTALLLRYTYYGDTDLDGAVDHDDLSRTDRGFRRNTPNWLGGDFDFDQSLTSGDYALLNRVFAAAGPVIAEPEAVVVATAVTAPLLVEQPKDLKFTGPSRGKARQTMTFTIAPLASAGTRRYAIDWNGDGRTDRIITARGDSTIRIRHAFKKSGVYRATLRLLGSDGPAITRKLVIRMT